MHPCAFKVDAALHPQTFLHVACQNASIFFESRSRSWLSRNAKRDQKVRNSTSLEEHESTSRARHRIAQHRRLQAKCAAATDNSGAVHER
jgi:hypothetical protein